MASSGRVLKVRKALKDRKRGRKRKNRINIKGSTPTKDAFFSGQDS